MPQDLSLAGNAIEAIPPQIANLTSLERLQVAGNRLQGLPHEIGALQRLEGLWVHGEPQPAAGSRVILAVLGFIGTLMHR